MSDDCILHPDAQDRAWRSNLVTYVNGHLADLALAAGDFVDLYDTAATWRTDYRARKCTTASGPRTIARPRLRRRQRPNRPLGIPEGRLGR
ncbi:MAG: hypothetical protein JSV78_01730 [Phycisphaerales bacterium]|nr:MAG: hypothetical protein JSV78_01730 [Phycisphaerales bacterium]